MCYRMHMLNSWKFSSQLSPVRHAAASTITACHLQISVSQNCSTDYDNVNDAVFDAVELPHADTVTWTPTSNMLQWHLGITCPLPQSIQSRQCLYHRCSILGFGGRNTPFDFLPSFFQSRQLFTRSARLACSRKDGNINTKLTCLMTLY